MVSASRGPSSADSRRVEQRPPTRAGSSPSDQSPLTRYGYSRDYGRFPLRPDPSQPYYDPGRKLDFPETAGNCAACHTPGAAVDAPYGTDPNTVSGADSFGVHCDFCRKIADVTLDPVTGLPFANMPGVLSMDIRRPFPDDPDRYQLFFGTFDDDNVAMEDTNLPLLQESQYCAPCHYGVFWDTVVYSSFGEWLDSPYSRTGAGKTCQQCRMPAPSELDGEILTNVAPGMGGVDRDPLTFYAHTQPGAANLQLLHNTAELRVGGAMSDANVTELAVAADNPALVYAATGNRGLLYSMDGGTTWSESLGAQPVLSVAIDPHDSRHVLARLLFGGLRMSTDAGTSWSVSAAGLPPEASISDIVFDPTDPQVIYVSDRMSGVYRSTDGGRTWAAINEGLRMRSVNKLALTPDRQRLYAATEGEGVYRLDLGR